MTDSFSRKTQEQYAKEELELFEKYDIPIELRQPLSYMAYEQGHSAGYEEVISILNEIVYDIAKPIQNLIKRIKNP